MTYLKKTFSVLGFAVGLLLVWVGFQALSYWMGGGIEAAAKRAGLVHDRAFFFQGRPLSTGSFHWYDRWAHWYAMKKFPDLEFCINANELSESVEADLDWNSLRNEEQARICLFHISKIKDTPEKLSFWLESQGFSSKFANNSAFGFPIITAFWREEERGSYSPFSLFSFWVVGEISPFVTSGLRIQVRYHPLETVVKEIQLHFGTF